MNQGRPEERGYRTAGDGRAQPHGRASVEPLPGGATLWRLPAGAEPIATRLLELGTRRVGGFIDGGVDTHGPWLVRQCDDRSVAHWLRDRAQPSWREVVEVVASLAAILAACEQGNVDVGRLHVRDLIFGGDDPTSAWVRAPQMVATLLGARAASDDSQALSRWVPPEQAAGAAWDHAARRYVLGLVLYRGLAGEHPFAGRGLRLGLSEQAQRGAPPFPEDIARRLPAGLQSLCLRLLDPAPANRPQRAEEIQRRLQELLSEGRPDDSPLHAPPPPRPATASLPGSRTAAPGPGPSTRRGTPVPAPVRRTGWRWLALMPWIAVAITALLWRPDRDAPVSKPALPTVAQGSPLSASQTRPDDCARCHAEQAAQWHGSVMSHSVRSPLFQALEILIQEQAGRSFDCPQGAGVLREADGKTSCRNRETGVEVTGSGGELWCVNCHAPGFNLGASLPAWDAFGGDGRSRRPLVDLLPASAMDGISCAFCHQVSGPVRPGNEGAGLYEGNPHWTSIEDGRRFSMRPEDVRGKPGIANSGYFLETVQLLLGREPSASAVPGRTHARPSDEARDYLQSSAFCGSCHDVRLFGTDAIGIRRGEHFKRLRNAYSEWVDWAADERAAGREPASCQDCHMSTFPGVCVPGEQDDLASSFGTQNIALQRACPKGAHFEPRAPGSRAPANLGASGDASTHYFTGVDVPLTDGFDPTLADDPTLDAAGIPRGARQRRDLLLGSTFRFAIGEARRDGDRLTIPIEIENVGAGHKVPAGFSQEREIWVHLQVTDATGRVVYEVGRVERPEDDLRDKVFVRVNVDDRFTDDQGRPLGVFGADVVDGPDVPRWSPEAGPEPGGRMIGSPEPVGIAGAERRGRGLINFQNGFLRCVRCIGEIDARGRCQPGPGQGLHRADRYADGEYDPDTGACFSNLSGAERFFETYFPVGSLDARRGELRAPDAIIDTRSAPPGVPQRWVYDLAARGQGPYTVRASLMFRAFPPFLVRAFADYEAQQAARGLRPSGPLVTHDMLSRLEVVELQRAEVVVP